jgi:hypothetical protein
LLFLLLFLITTGIPLGIPYGGVAGDRVLRLEDLNRGSLGGLSQMVAIVQVRHILNVMVYLLLILQNHLGRMLAIWAASHVVLPEGLICESCSHKALWRNFTEKPGVKLRLDFCQVRFGRGQGPSRPSCCRGVIFVCNLSIQNAEGHTVT